MNLTSRLLHFVGLLENIFPCEIKIGNIKNLIIIMKFWLEKALLLNGAIDP